MAVVISGLAGDEDVRIVERLAEIIADLHFHALDERAAGAAAQVLLEQAVGFTADGIVVQAGVGHPIDAPIDEFGANFRARFAIEILGGGDRQFVRGAGGHGG